MNIMCAVHGDTDTCQENREQASSFLFSLPASSVFCSVNKQTLTQGVRD